MPAPTIQANSPATLGFLKAVSREQERILALADHQHSELMSIVQSTFEQLASMEHPFEEEPRGLQKILEPGFGKSDVSDLMNDFSRTNAPAPTAELTEQPAQEVAEGRAEIVEAPEVGEQAEASQRQQVGYRGMSMLRSWMSRETYSNYNDAQRLVGIKRKDMSKLKKVLDFVAGTLVLLNALVMVFELEMEGLAAGVFVGLGDGPRLDEVEPVFRMIDAVFVYLFLVELLCRVYAERWHWTRDVANWFDAFLVLVSLVDMYVLTPLATANDSQGEIVRSLRTLKSLRAIRVLRTFRFFDGLQLFAKACSSLLPSLGWSLVVLGMFICMGALFLGNMLRSFVLDDAAPLADRQWIWNRYGTAYRATYTLYEVTFAGNWPTNARPVLEKVSHTFVIFFLVYITIIVFAMIRLISAIFLKDTLDAAQNDAENLVLQRLRKKAEYLQKLEDVFAAIDETGDGMITEERLAKVFANPTAVAYFQTLDIDVSESAALFHILDNGDGEVTHEEFIDGIMRCKGPARAMDQVAMLADLRQLDSKLSKVIKGLQDAGGLHIGRPTRC